MEKQELPRFQVGDWVEWTSGANGSQKTKRGIVEVVIPAGKAIWQTSWKKSLLIKYQDLYTVRIDGGSLPRNHESYIVVVPAVGKQACARVYYPRVAGLRKVEEMQ